MEETVYTNFVKGPINPLSIGRYIGINTGDVGTVCSSTNINQWAKWKPVQFRSPVPISADDVKSTHFGLTPVQNLAAYYTLNSSFRTKHATDDADWQAVIDGSKVWEYARPQGGAAQPYRLSDFCDPERPKDTWGYKHDTPPPIDEFRPWQIMKSTLESLMNGAYAAAHKGSDGKEDPNNFVYDTYYGSVVYANFKMRFGDASGLNLNGASTYAIPLNDLLEVAADGNYYRLCLAVRVPGNESLEIVCPRLSFWEARNLTGSTTVVQAITPYLSTNQYLCYLLHQLVGTNLTAEVEAIPLIISNVRPGSIGRITGIQNGNVQWSRPSIIDGEGNSKVYSVPANTSVIKIQIVNDVNYSADDRFIAEHFSLYRSVGEIIYIGGTASWNKVNVNTIRLDYTKETPLTADYTIRYSVECSYIVGVQGNTFVTRQETRTGTHTFPAGTKAGDTAATFLIGSGQPALSFNRYTLTKA